jgi:alpha-1,4-digalacturonate transport system permease protein
VLLARVVADLKRIPKPGVLNGLLVGVGVAPTEWLTSARMFFWANWSAYGAHGFYTLIVRPGCRDPEGLCTRREMDSASPWRVLRRITLPLLMPNLLVVIVLALIRAVQIFDEVFVLTGGGPGTATTFLVQFIYQTGFAEAIHLYGLAAAASLVLAGALLVLTLLQLKIAGGGEAKDGNTKGGAGHA